MKFWKLFAGLLVIGFCQTTHAQDPATAQLRAELEEMLASDQALRLEARSVAEKFGHNSAENAALWARQNSIDDATIRRLGEIVQSNGWPKQSTVGVKAASAAFLVVQHASLAHQHQFLPLLRDAVAQGEARSEDLALLEDRILMREGRPQVYGSQVVIDKATREKSFHVIEDEANVDQRRAAVGLEPLAEYAKRFGFVYQVPK